jgi:uncharacterized protein (DUF1800 family)
MLGVAASDSKLTQQQRALHALNRLGFGARPGDVDRVTGSGVDVWIDEQLHPERIPDDAVQSSLQQFATLGMSDADILRTYYAPVLMAQQQAQQAAADAAAGKPGGARGDPAEIRKQMIQQMPPEKRPQRVLEELTAQRVIRALDSDRQLNEVMVDFWFNHFNVFAGKGIDRFLLTSYERDVIRPHVWGRFDDLLMATAKSPAMLFYLDNARSVADPANRPKAAPRVAARASGRGLFGGGFRPRRLGIGVAVMPPRQQNPNQNKGGLNENYAREIMELHTLGVNGGYTQKDVTELARVFTGWTIAGPQQGDGFIFRAQLHDVGAKTVLGVHFPAGGGIEEGEQMIHILAHHPATAHHIAFELCQRLVADDPPPALVDRVAKKFLDSDGDLRQTVKAVIDSPEFWDPRYYHAKVKSPFEYEISAVRAIGAKVTNPMAIARTLQQMGEPLYGAQPPTGYSDVAATWVNTGALMNRLNFALALAANRIPGVKGDVTALIPADAAADSQRSVDALAQVLTGGDLTAATRTTIKSRIAERTSPQQDPWDNTQLPTVAGLILGSPEFQRQ